ncbi:MAG TPA: hypothetical protein VIJ12_03100 [Candidatus Baltobacteraceae bacterium]
MSRFTGMSVQKRRAWGYGLVVFFVVMCGAIAFAQWWAINKNVPAWERRNAAASARPAQH